MTRKQEVLRATRGHNRQSRSTKRNAPLDTELREIDAYSTASQRTVDTSHAPFSDWSDYGGGGGGPSRYAHSVTSAATATPSSRTRRPPQGLSNFSLGGDFDPRSRSSSKQTATTTMGKSFVSLNITTTDDDDDSYDDLDFERKGRRSQRRNRGHSASGRRSPRKVRIQRGQSPRSSTRGYNLSKHT